MERIPEPVRAGLSTGFCTLFGFLALNYFLSLFFYLPFSLLLCLLGPLFAGVFSTFRCRVRLLEDRISSLELDLKALRASLPERRS